MEYAVRHDDKLNYYVAYNKTTNTILIITHNKSIAYSYIQQIKNKTIS